MAKNQRINNINIENINKGDITQQESPAQEKKKRPGAIKSKDTLDIDGKKLTKETSKKIKNIIEKSISEGTSKLKEIEIGNLDEISKNLTSLFLSTSINLSISSLVLYK